MWYLSYFSGPELEEEMFGDHFLITFLMWLLLLNTLVPISLLVTVEVVKFIQALLIERDQNYIRQGD